MLVIVILKLRLLVTSCQTTIMTAKKHINLSKLIGSKLKKAREYRGLSQEELARQTNFNHSSISYFENGKRRISVENLIEFSRVLKIKPTYFLSDIDTK